MVRATPQIVAVCLVVYAAQVAVVLTAGVDRMAELSFFSERIPPFTAGVNRVSPVRQSTRVCPTEYSPAQVLLELGM
jgi:ABC-type arginine transport system permease subunit